MKHLEDSLQMTCYAWFSAQYPALRRLCFHPANGGKRNAIEAARFKKLGVVAGVSDLILLLPNAHHNALCIEMKAGKGVQSEHQKAFQADAEKAGAKYVICRSVDEFVSEIKGYLNEK